jgi:hypothetical protein
MILPSAAGLKSLNDLERVWDEPAQAVLERTDVAMDPFRVWDIATLAILPEYRGRAASGIVALGLYQGMFSQARLEGVAQCVTVLDVVVLRQVQYQFKKPFSRFVGIEPRRYLGSPLSIPMWCDIRSWRQRLLQDRTDMHEMLFRGGGLSEAVRLPTSLRARLDAVPVASVTDG